MKKDLEYYKKECKRLNSKIKEIYSFYMYDKLTKALSRDYFDNELKNEYENKDLNIVMADLNNLKITNDLQGHLAGDILLKDISNKFKTFGLTIRLGGDEFIIIVDDIVKFKKFAENQDDFAFGYHHKKISESLSFAISEADSEMYIHKYIQHKKNRIKAD